MIKKTYPKKKSANPKPGNFRSANPAPGNFRGANPPPGNFRKQSVPAGNYRGANPLLPNTAVRFDSPQAGFPGPGSVTPDSSARTVKRKFK